MRKRLAIIVLCMGFVGCAGPKYGPAKAYYDATKPVLEQYMSLDTAGAVVSLGNQELTRRAISDQGEWLRSEESP